MTRTTKRHVEWIPIGALGLTYASTPQVMRQHALSQLDDDHREAIEAVAMMSPRHYYKEKEDVAHVNHAYHKSLMGQMRRAVAHVIQNW